MKAIEQCFPVVLFIMLYKEVQIFESEGKSLKPDLSKSYWVVLSCGVIYIILYKVILSFESVDQILKCDHSDESYWAFFSYGAFYYALQGCSNFHRNFEDKILNCDHSEMKATKQYLIVVVLFQY